MNDYASAQRDVNRLVCAVCWGDLMIIETTAGFQAICHKAHADQCSGAGFVTRRYAERRKQESIVEKMEVKNLYTYTLKMPEVVGLTEPEAKNEKQLLSELGF